MISKAFPNQIINAVISRNLETVYYTRPKEQNLIKTSLLDFHEGWEYIEEPIERAKALNPRKYHLKISQNERYLVEYGEKNIYVYSSQNKVLLKKVKHLCEITCLDIHPKNESIIIGDKIGKIGFYYNVFNPDAKIALSSFHWHSHQVNCIFMTSDGTQLLSAGEEGVVVFWHLLANKQTFCPRLGSSIVSIGSDPTRTTFAALLDSNTLKLVKTNNYEEIASISSLTDPGNYTKNESIRSSVLRNSLNVHPKTSTFMLLFNN
jgi:WD40 repeat protein